MKSFCFAASLLILISPALSAEDSAPQVAPPQARPRGAPDTGFQDPFASESQSTHATKIKDPLKSMNRVFFKFNDKLYFWALKPAAKGYSKVVPRPARTCISRLFANVKYPIHLLNNLLQ